MRYFDLTFQHVFRKFFGGGKNLKLGKDIWISLYLTTTDSTMERQKFCPLKYEHKEIYA